MRLALRLVSMLAALAAALAGALVLAEPAYACSCVGTSAAQAYARADAVFRGTVLTKSAVGRGAAARQDIRFDVDGVFKGIVHREQVVASARDSAGCGLDPDVGSSWVIFATQAVEGSGSRAVNRLVTSLCSGNLPGSKTPSSFGAAQQPLPGASDREERTVLADRRVTTGLTVLGVSLLGVATAAGIGLAVLWRPGRRATSRPKG